MKIERIKVGKSIEAIGLWHRADLEVVVGESENPDEVFAEAKALIDKWLPGMDVPKVMQYEPEIKLTNEERRKATIDAHVKTIQECKTMKNLEMFANMVQRENIDVLYEAYNVKKKELQNV